MELAAQPICLPICMNAYFFRGRFVLHLQTGNVNRSAISSGAFAVFPLEIHWIQSWNTPPCLWNSKLRYPPTSSEFQSKKPPLSLGIPRCRPWYGMDIFWNHPIKIWIKKYAVWNNYLYPFKANIRLRNTLKKSKTYMYIIDKMRNEMAKHIINESRW